MKILGIETSCDETAAAVIEVDKTTQRITLLSNILATSLALHAKTGGIIPEIAAREQLKYILPVIDESLKKASVTPKDIDAIAVTIGPGLIGSLLVGVETARTLSYVWNKPIIPVNHLFGHIYANFIQNELNAKRYTLNPIEFPTLALIVSGGHTDLVIMKSHNNVTWLGGTRDDAAGEAFDKIGRMLGFSYPSGPTIEKRAKDGDSKKYIFPRPMMHSGDFDFSFSGLKAAAMREIAKIKLARNALPEVAASLQAGTQSVAGGNIDEQTKNDICAGIQQAIIDVIVKKALLAAHEYKVKSILLGGGVAANQSLVEQLEVSSQKLGVKLFVPQKFLCTDNAAMIAAAAFYQNKPTSWKKVIANPELYFE